jgi:hypothetical protein
MKIVFEDKSYIDCQKLDDKIIFIISAKDGNNSNKKIVNAVEITEQEFLMLISDIK